MNPTDYFNPIRIRIPVKDTDIHFAVRLSAALSQSAFAVIAYMTVDSFGSFALAPPDSEAVRNQIVSLGDNFEGEREFARDICDHR